MRQWSAIRRAFSSWEGEAEPDSYRDFLGTRTRLRYLPEPYMRLAGTVQAGEGAPGPTIHDIVEWNGVLDSVLDAGGSFTCVELGAGFGPFVVGAARAAKQRGIEQIRLIAVEADATHFEWMKEHFSDNELNPETFDLRCAVVGAYDGLARFAKLSNPRMQWGCEATFGETEVDGYIEVPCVSLPTLLGDVDVADVIHFDVQGAEFDIIAHAIATLNHKAKRLVIGTHGRDLEHNLFALLHEAGWTLEEEAACRMQQLQRGIVLKRDGVQIWTRKPTDQIEP